MSVFLFQAGDTRWDGSPLTDCLSAAEQARASRFRFAEHARLHRVCRAMARHILACACGGDPTALPWAEQTHGKPFLHISPPLHFNLSHSEDWVLMAASATLEVGVDLEMLIHSAHANGLSNGILSPDEAQTHATSPSGLHQLLQTWVRKEACLKALGVGLTQEMPDMTLLPQCGQVSLGPAFGASAQWGSDLHWVDLPLPSECAGIACLAWLKA